MAEEISDRRALALLVVVGLVWGAAYPFIRYGLVSGATPVAFAAARYALSAVALAALAAATRLPRPTVRQLGLSALLGLPIIGIYGLFLYVGEQSTSGGLASILIGSTPLITALWAAVLLTGDRIGRGGVVGLLLGFVGVVVLVFPPPGVVLAASFWGPVFVLAAAVSVAFGTVLLRRLKPDGETLWGVSVQFLVATGFLALLLPVVEPRAALPANSGTLGSLAFLVVGSSLVGYALYFYLHHQIGPVRANVVAYVNPIAALSIGTLLFAEPFEPWELAGFALVMLGLTVLTRYRARGAAAAPRERSRPPRSSSTVRD